VAEPRQRRLSLDELQRDLAQVAPVHNENEFDSLADALRSILSEPRTANADTPRVLDKAAVWARVQEEIDRIGADAHEDTDPGAPPSSATAITRTDEPAATRSDDGTSE
jgi:hypothetical protein